MAIIANAQYTEITGDTTLTAIEGKQYYIKNTDSLAHVITYGASTFTLPASQIAQFTYVGSAWISGVANISNFEALEITGDTALTAVEGKQYLVKNTDASTHTITYGSDTTTVQQNYTCIFYYVNSAWVYLGAFNKDGDMVVGGNLSALGTITGASATPGLYDFYDQEPQTATPASKFAGTSWINVSQRSLFYHLAATSGGAETDVVIRDLVEHNDGIGNWSIDKEYAFADLVYDDVIGGSGTHAGKYVIAVDNYSGLFSRYEGGYAEDFENGIKKHTMQRIKGSWNQAGNTGVLGPVATGVFAGMATSTSLSQYFLSAAAASRTTYLDSIGDPGVQSYNVSGDGDGNEGANPGETAPDSFTKKKWRRTA